MAAAHRPERLAAEIHVRAGHDDAQSAVRQHVGRAHDAPVQELDLVDRDDLRVGPDLLHQLPRGLHRLGIDARAVVRVHRRDPAVAVAQVVIETLSRAARQHGAPHSPDQFLGLAAEHDPADDLDPPHTF